MKRKVHTAQLPEKSVCKKHLSVIDFQDSYKVKLSNRDISIENIYINVFAHSPKWTNVLLAIRNKIVGIFGLDTYREPSEVVKKNLKVGLKTGIFKIYAILEKEIIAGEDDKHLNFRVSVLKQSGELFISTLVHYNNWFGKMYMTLIIPFHKRVIRAILKSAVKNNRI